MRESTESDGHTAVRPLQREYGHILSAAAVATMAARVGTAGYIQLAADLDALCAQDAAWRACVGELLDAAAEDPVLMRYEGGAWYSQLSPRLNTALKAAQAALAADA